MPAKTVPESPVGARSARTRARLIVVAERLFAERGVNSVSLNTITTAAGQKNRSALQYHFGNRDGLLQAIIDRHARRVHALRETYMLSPELADQPPAAAAARGLIIPLARYIVDEPSGAMYVKILSQLAAMNSRLINPATRSGLSFQEEALLREVLLLALAHLGKAEAQRRLFIVVGITFHSLADICRVHAAADKAPALADREALFEQLALGIEALLRAPASER